METIFAITWRILKINSKRTILTVLTIVLSVSMITTVLCGGWSMLRFLQEKETVYGGDYAYSIDNLTYEQTGALQQGENIKDVSLFQNVGNAFYGEKSNQTLLAIAGVSESFIKNFYLEQYLEIGRFPQSSNEIVITQSFIDKNNLSITAGDTMNLAVGNRIWDEIDAELYGMVNYLGDRESFRLDTEKEYTVVGIVSDIDNSKVAGNFNAFTGIEEQSSELTAYIKCGHMSNSIYSEAYAHANEFGQEADINDDLLLYYGITGGKGAAKLIALFAAIIILFMCASAAMISNVLSISLQERIKQLGMLSSVGASNRQKRASVTFEAFLLGVTGIPVGLVAGVGLTALVLVIIRKSFEAAFTVGIVKLGVEVNFLIILLSAISAVISLMMACRTPARAAGKVTVIEAIRQSNVYQIKGSGIRKAGLTALLFGVYGSLASKNIKRNPKRFRAITGSIFLMIVLGLSLYSLSDFMVYQTSLEMNEDGSCYVDVETAVPYQDISVAGKALADANIAADVSYNLSRYMTIKMDGHQINPEMEGYFINGSVAEIYVVGLDEEHFYKFCDDNGLDRSDYLNESNHGILINSATGDYGTSKGKVVVGSPFIVQNGEIFELEYAGEAYPALVQDILGTDNIRAQNKFVCDRAVLVVPISYYSSMLGPDTYVMLSIKADQHKEAAECLADRGFFQTVDVASATQNTRQVYYILKLAICVFTILMTMIISLNLCNTISNTIYIRRSEFAVLRSVGMTGKGLRNTLLLEAGLYGVKALVVALPISFGIHYVMYKMISSGMTPFVFYIDIGVYAVVVMLVVFIVITAMLFSIRSISKVKIIDGLKVQ